MLSGSRSRAPPSRHSGGTTYSAPAPLRPAFSTSCCRISCRAVSSESPSRSPSRPRTGARSTRSFPRRGRRGGATPRGRARRSRGRSGSRSPRRRTRAGRGRGSARASGTRGRRRPWRRRRRAGRRRRTAPDSSQRIRTGFSAIGEASWEKRSCASVRVSTESESQPVRLSTNQKTSARAPITTSPTRKRRTGAQSARPPSRSPSSSSSSSGHPGSRSAPGRSAAARGPARAGRPPERTEEEVHLQAERDEEGDPDRHRRTELVGPEDPGEHEDDERDAQRRRQHGEAGRRAGARSTVARRSVQAPAQAARAPPAR